MKPSSDWGGSTCRMYGSCLFVAYCSIMSIVRSCVYMFTSPSFPRCLHLRCLNFSLTLCSPTLFTLIVLPSEVDIQL